MYCKYCKTQMVIGDAIKPDIKVDGLTIMPTAPIQFKDLEIIAVYKCPNCGHSEDIS